MTNYKELLPNQGSCGAYRELEDTMLCKMYKCWVIVELVY